MKTAIILWVASCALAISIIAIFASADVASVLIKAIAVVMVVFPLLAVHASKQSDELEKIKKERTLSAKKIPAITKKTIVLEKKSFTKEVSQERVFKEEGVLA